MSKKRVRIVSHTDGHGVACLASALNDARLMGFEAIPLCEYPATCKYTLFWNNVVPTLIDEAELYDEVWILDIAFDNRNPEGCIEKLKELASKTMLRYIDHHPIRIVIPEELKDNVRIVRRARDVGVQCSMPQVLRIGAICDRDPAELPVTDEELRIAAGLDALKYRVDLVRLAERMSKGDFATFLKGGVHHIRYPSISAKLGDVILCDGRNLERPEGFKSLEQEIIRWDATYGLMYQHSVMSAIRLWTKTRTKPLFSRGGLEPFDNPDMWTGHSNAVRRYIEGNSNDEDVLYNAALALGVDVPKIKKPSIFLTVGQSGLALAGILQKHGIKAEFVQLFPAFGYDDEGWTQELAEIVKQDIDKLSEDNEMTHIIDVSGMSPVNNYIFEKADAAVIAVKQLTDVAKQERLMANAEIPVVMRICGIKPVNRVNFAQYVASLEYDVVFAVLTRLLNDAMGE